MAKKKNGFDTTALMKYAERLEEAGGHAAIARAVQAGMATTKQEINKLLEAAVEPGNLPAGGKYSTGDTKQSIDRQMTATWSGNEASMPLGFNLKKGGLASIMLMYGTPKMRPVPGLYEALYGNAGKRIARKAQEEAMQKILERLGG